MLTLETPEKDQFKCYIAPLEAKIVLLSSLGGSGFEATENTNHLTDSHDDQLKQV